MDEFEGNPNPFAGPSNSSRAEEEEPIFDGGDVGDEEAHATEDARDELYAIMNLSKDATQQEITASYKKLAALLHPDRHPDPTLKSAADSRFQAVNRAFEVLSDPRRRMIYDSLGEEGLKTTWDVGSKYKTSAELRAEFERLGRKQAEASMENLIKSKGELTCTLDARVLLLTDEKRRALGGPRDMTFVEKINTVASKQMFLKHSFTNPITAATSVVLTSQLLSRQGTGGGNLLIKVKHQVSAKQSLEIGTTMLRPRALTFKSSYAPDSDTFVTFETAGRTTLAPPPFSVVFGRRIFDDITATFSVQSGAYCLGSWGKSSLEEFSSSTLTFGLINNKGWSTSLTTGLGGSQANGDYGFTSLAGVKLRIGGAITFTGEISTYIAGDRRITESTKVGMVLDFSNNGVMTLKLSGTRLGQKITFPIIVSSSWDLRIGGMLILLPSISVLALNHFVVIPRRKKRISNRISELRKENAEFIAEKRQEAIDATALLAEHVNRKIESERKSNGLIIEQGLYGVLDSTATTEIDSRIMDVTVALQALITNSQLNIPSGRSKSNLLGFYDVAMGEKKSLSIRYYFKGRLHEVVLEDRAAVALPLRGHLVD